MHEIQQKIMSLSESKNLGNMTLRQIGDLVGEKFPQKIKHHLDQLQKKGLIKIDKARGVIERVKSGKVQNSSLISVPIVGAANCGEATIYADEICEGYLKISPALLNKTKNVFAIKAEGSSMNKSNINGKQIEDGDFLIIDSEYKQPKNGDVVLSVIDGMANIKRYFEDRENNQVVLVSESTRSFAPIYIHQDDDFLVNGRVIQVIKKPKF